MTALLSDAARASGSFLCVGHERPESSTVVNLVIFWGQMSTSSLQLFALGYAPSCMKFVASIHFETSEKIRLLV